MTRSTSSKPVKSPPFDLGNESFFQIQDQAVPYVDALVAANPAAFRVFWWLTRQVNKQNKAIADQKRIGAELSLHRNTVGSAVAYLRKHRFLETYKAGTTTGYCLNAWVIWRDSRSTRTNAPFLQSLQQSATSDAESTSTRVRSAGKAAISPQVKTADSPVIKALQQQVREMERQQALERKSQKKISRSYSTSRSFEPSSPSLEEWQASEGWAGESNNDYGYGDE